MNTYIYPILRSAMMRGFQIKNLVLVEKCRELKGCLLMRNVVLSVSPILIILLSTNARTCTPLTCYLKVRDSRTFSNCAQTQSLLRAKLITSTLRMTKISYLAARVRFPDADQKKSELGDEIARKCYILTFTSPGAHAPVIVGKFPAISPTFTSLQF